MLNGLSGFCGAQFDAVSPPLHKAYVVAATLRCGSTYFCTLLWKSGVLGAPFEYFNYEADMRVMQSRLSASSPADYLQKLLAHRTSPNGVFGFKAHFPHFKAALRRDPRLLESLGQVRFVYLERRDTIAQAVSLARAYQTRAWSSLDAARRAPLFYSTEFIAACLHEIEQQRGDWNRWLDANVGERCVLQYEDVCRDEAAAVDRVCRWVGVDRQTVDSGQIVGPEVVRQADHVNAEWIQRFEAECGRRVASDQDAS